MPLSDDCYPQRGWLADYLDYAPRGLHAPRIYHLACGLFCVSAAAGPTITVSAGAEPIPLNLYLTLLGPSGLAQKSRSIDRARAILQAVKTNLLLADEFSREALYQALAEDAHRVLLWREFGKYLQISRRDYMAGTTEFLTELFDCPPEPGRILKGITYTIKRPHLGILTASTPDWLFRHMSEVDIHAGFFPRFLYVPYEPKPPRQRGVALWDQTRLNRLVADLHACVQSPRALTLGENQTPYDGHEEVIEDRIMHGEISPLCAPFSARRSLLLAKIAACYHIAESDAPVISRDAFSRALALVGYLFMGFDHLLAAKWASNPQDAQTQRVREIIRQSPSISHSKLQRNSHLSARDLNQVLETLRAGGEFRETTGGKSGKERFYTLAPEEGEGEKEAK